MERYRQQPQGAYNSGKQPERRTTSPERRALCENNNSNLSPWSSATRRSHLGLLVRRCAVCTTSIVLACFGIVLCLAELELFVGYVFQHVGARLLLLSVKLLLQGTSRGFVCACLVRDVSYAVPVGICDRCVRGTVSNACNSAQTLQPFV